MIKECDVCHDEFNSHDGTLRCSPECNRIAANRRQAKYVERNKEVVRARIAEYQRRNRDLINQKRRDRYDPEAHRSVNDKFRSDNPEYSVYPNDV